MAQKQTDIAPKSNIAPNNTIHDRFYEMNALNDTIAEEDSITVNLDSASVELALTVSLSELNSVALKVLFGAVSDLVPTPVCI